jgi:ribosome-associated protein
MLWVTDRIQIAAWELEFSYARSSGPGGQNVNKVNSKAVLHWYPGRSGGLPADVRQRFLEQNQSRLTAEGAIVITSDRHRDQGRNREDCLEKLAEMLRKVATPPRKRKKTKATYSSQVKRKDTKRKHGDKKRLRGPIDDH